MANKSATCPECGVPIGPGSGTDAYKHIVHCFHLPPEGVERLLAQYEGKDDERSRRIVEGLQAAK